MNPLRTIVSFVLWATALMALMLPGLAQENPKPKSGEPQKSTAPQTPAKPETKPETKAETKPTSKPSKPRPIPQGPMVLVRTQDLLLAKKALEMLESKEPLPTLEEGSHLELTLAGDRQVKIEAKPGALEFS